jgi:hypothetical protein
MKIKVLMFAKMENSRVFKIQHKGKFIKKKKTVAIF